MQLTRAIKFYGTRDLLLRPDQEFIGFAAYCGYGVPVDYVLVAPDALAYEVGSGRLGVGGIFTRDTVRSSSTGAKVAFPDQRHLLVLNSREERVSLVTANQLDIGESWTDVDGTGCIVKANTVYEFKFWIIATCDSDSTGVEVACNGPASPTAIRYTQTSWASSGGSMMYAEVYDNDPGGGKSAGAAAAIYVAEGVLSNGVNDGTLIARIKRTGGSSGPNVRAGSFGKVRQLP